MIIFQQIVKLMLNNIKLRKMKKKEKITHADAQKR